MTLLYLLGLFLSKLKKLIRYIQSKQGSYQEQEIQKKLQRYETDHFLEPFAGLTPEYMEMSWYHTKSTSSCRNITAQKVRCRLI